MKNLLIGLLVLLQACLFFGGTAEEELMSSLTCDTPSILTGPVQVGPYFSASSYNEIGIVWDGVAYGAVWVAGDHIHFARIAADGTFLAGPRQITPALTKNYEPDLIWADNMYALAWTNQNGSNSEVFFVLLDRDANQIIEPVQVTSAAGYQSGPAVCWTGSEFGLTWKDPRNAGTSGDDIYFARIDGDGEYIAGSETAVSEQVNSQTEPRIEFVYDHYFIFWEDDRNGNYDIFGRRLSNAGSLVGAEINLVVASGDSIDLSLAWNGVYLGIAWTDNRDGNENIYFTLVDSNGTEIGNDRQITNDSATQRVPSLAWSGREFGMVFMDNRNPSNLTDVYFVRLSTDGTMIDSELLLIESTEAEFTSSSSLAVGNAGYGIGILTLLSMNYKFYSIGCDDDVTDPYCPAQPAECSRMSSTVTLCWGPGKDRETEIAYYRIYKNGLEYDISADRWWTDSSFDPADGTHYYIETVNALGWTSPGCDMVDTTDEVQPTCPGNLLAAEVGEDHVILTWLPAFDALSGISHYSVYRDNGLEGLVNSPTATFEDVHVYAETTYNYAVTATDFAGNEQTACSSIWVSTSPITLTIAKNPDGIHANLDWNDVGLPEYRVFRSTTPQGTSELKRVEDSMTTDPVLQDGVQSWFYFIQQKGL
ncbi:MAG TPA: hypothetical protein PK014_07750 [Thermoanaerobaculia bacterium]|nr:hypothetical protein [Thermoanaerobaculia bacterium]HUM30000.1 hypothetical protein [Thermoanaerobaculia bacterium]HXK68311.1 hypothetical protein [Thermoanaerobaculia bacterium]